MLKSKLGFKKITEDTDNFSLEGMIEPTFYNFGDENVHVYHSVVEPGNKFFAGCLDRIMVGEIPIRFEGNNKKGRNLSLYFGTDLSDC